jgi:DNA-binding transcriptional LysR family regulator
LELARIVFIPQHADVSVRDAAKTYNIRQKIDIGKISLAAISFCMSLEDLDWNLCRSFLAVIREGSLSAAARVLGLTQPTIGRHIESLERKLGAVLFTRWQHGLHPTEIALDLVPHLEVMAAATATLVRTASGEVEQARGTVRLTASEVVGAEVLPPILSAFRERYEGIVIEFLLSNHTENLLKREADIAVRMVRPDQSGLVARHIGQVPISLYVHRSYAERYGIPQTLDELVRYPIIGYDTAPSASSVLKSAKLTVTRDLFSFRTDSGLAQLAMLRAGYGIGGCQDALARRNPDLLPVLHDTIRFEIPMWLVMHEDLRSTRRVRLLFDHLACSLASYLGRPARLEQAPAER